MISGLHAAREQGDRQEDAVYEMGQEQSRNWMFSEELKEVLGGLERERLIRQRLAQFPKFFTPTLFLTERIW